MPKTAEQKTRLLKLLEILQRETDEAHPMTEAQLRARLGAAGIDAERKTVLSDLHALEDFGIDVVNRRGRRGGFFIASRDFELAELKLLVDAVQASKFISEKKSDALIRKLCNLTSRYEAGKLARGVYVSGRVKQENKAVLYTVDTIHTAINEKCKISFLYNEWTINKTLKPRHNGARYKISPWRLMMEEGYYYLVGYDEAAECLKHFRVDKITEACLVEENRVGTELYEHLDPALYAGETFGMYGGEEKLVTLLCDKTLIGIILDRFGSKVTLREADETHFSVTVRVRISPVFRGWVLGYGARMRVVAPTEVAEDIRAVARAALLE